jgi:translation initiation factor 2 alpha subunit (eIF-2alpha)
MTWKEHNEFNKKINKIRKQKITSSFFLHISHHVNENNKTCLNLIRVDRSMNEHSKEVESSHIVL